jgi:HD-GYP domain-containing protein (c-di-GMP phosphodiesterase class II)
MAEQPLQTAPQPIKEGVFAELEAALRGAFDVDFRLWHPDARPLSVPLDRADQAAGLSEADLGEVMEFERAAELFERAALPQAQPECVAASEGLFWLVLPIGKGHSTEVIATALVRTADDALLLKLARQFQQRHELQAWVGEFASERDTLICQITADFEELAFLRQMAEKLAMADSSLNTMELAAEVLPDLRERVHAEAIVFVSAGRDKAACMVGRPVLTEGCNTIDDKSCTRLVERFRDAAALQPVVRNHCASLPELESVEGLRNFILVPLARSKSVLGWLLAINRAYTPTDGPRRPGWRLSRQEFGTNEASLLRSTASVLATHSTNVDLLKDKDQLLLDMVRALVNSIEAKDRYTCGHSERVALYAKQLASAMGLKARVCKRIYLSGLLHDVGKIAVRDAVLSKDGRLDDDEFREIQTHPDKGWGILFGLEALDTILAGVLHHHERWDGTGYPDGLTGESIPQDARILAVADAFDAMTSDRPYRKALSLDRAESILREGAGKQWDPTAIGIFLSILPEIDRIRHTYEPRQPATRRGYGTVQEFAELSLDESIPAATCQ